MDSTIVFCVDGITIEVSTENLALVIENILNGVSVNV